MATVKVCQTCLAWKEWKGDWGIARGQCRRHPPIRSENELEKNPAAIWHVTRFDDWCMEWVSKERKE